MSNDHFRKGMHALSLKLTAALKASGPLGDALTKGEMREEDIIEALRPHIPRRYELVKGIIVSADGSESDPQDIILVDSFTMPQIYGNGHNKAVPVESVVGTIQVKSVASAKEIKSAVNNIASAKRMLSDEPRYGFSAASGSSQYMESTSATFFGGIIFLDKTPRSRDATHTKNFATAAMSLPKRERPDAMCLLDYFTVLWTNMDTSAADGIEFCFRGAQAERPIFLAAKEDSILFFHLSLSEHLANWITPPISWLKYARPGQFEYHLWVDDLELHFLSL
jgi:hypothetical protein